MAFDSLIRRIEHSSYEQSAADHYLYDPISARLVPKLPFWRSGRIQAYQIALSQAAERSEKGRLGPFLVPGTGLRGRVQFHIDYQAWVEEENLLDLFSACAGDTPAATLTEKLIELIKLVVARQPEVFDGGDPSVAEQLLREAEDLTAKECGLHVILHLRPEDSLQAPVIATELEAYSRDCPSALRLRIEVESAILHRDVPLAAVSLQHRPESYLQELVARVTRDLARELPTAQLRAALHSEVKRRLTPALEKALAPHYLQIRAVRLSLLSGAAAPPEGYDGELSMQVPLRGHRSEQPVRVQLHLQRANEAAYWSAGAPALATWTDVDARRVIARLLTGVTYSQLCLERQRWEATLIEALRVAASAIGYDLTADVALPPPPMWLLAPMTLVVEDTFATAASEVRTELAVVLRVKLDGFDSIRPCLDRGDDVEATICQVVREEIATLLHQLQPGHLFTAFNRPITITAFPGAADSGCEDEPMTVERRLRERISKALERTFQARILELTARLGASELRDRHDALLGAPAIEFVVEAQLDGDAAPVTHRGALVVTEIAAEDWLTFQRRKPTPEVLATTASLLLKTLIAQRANALRDVLSADELRELAQRALPGELRKQLGVTVQCPGWSREDGIDNAALALLRAEIRARHYRDRLQDDELIRKKLQTLKQQLLSAELSDDANEVGELKRQIQVLQGHSSLGELEPQPPPKRALAAELASPEQSRSS